MKLRELLRSDFANYIRPMIISDKCEICGNKEDLHLHHSSKRFIDMLGETLEFLSLNENDNCEDYNEKDIKIIRNMMIAEQIKISYNTLCRKCHMDTHRKKILLPSGKTKALKYKTEFFHHMDNIGEFFILNIDEIANKDNIFIFCYLLTFADKYGYIILDNSITKTKKTFTNNKGARANTSNRYCQRKDLKYLFEELGKTKLNEAIQYFIDNDMLEIEVNTKYVKVSRKYYHRGSYIIHKEKDKRFKGEIRVFDNAIKSIYKNSTPSQYKKLDVLIKLCQYCNVYNNIICKNTGNIDRNTIEVYKLPELTKVFGYGRVADFKNTIFDLKIYNQYIIKDININGKNTIVINPLLYYKGNVLSEMIECEEYFSNGE